MKTEEQCEHLIDLDTVESLLEYLAGFGHARGFLPSHGFRCCAQFGRCRSTEGESEPEE